MTELEIEELERKVTGSNSRRDKKCRGFAGSCRRRSEKSFAGNGSRRAG